MDKKEFGKRLRTLRKTKTNYTMKEFGAKFNLAESTISGYENGSRMPDAAIINKFASFFDVTTDYLLGRTDNPSSHINIAYDGGFTPKDDEEKEYVKEQLQHFRKMKKRMQERLEKDKK